MQRATLGKTVPEVASQLQGRIARAFSSNSLVNTMDMTAAIQYILTAKQSLGSQVYYKKNIFYLFNSHYYSFMKTNLTIIKAYQNT